MFLLLHVVTYFLLDCFRSVITIPLFQFPDLIWPRTLWAASRRASRSPRSRPPPTTRSPPPTPCLVTAPSQREWSQPPPTSRCRQTTTTRGRQAATPVTRARGPPRQCPITWAAWAANFTVSWLGSWVPSHINFLSTIGFVRPPKRHVQERNTFITLIESKNSLVVNWFWESFLQSLLFLFEGPSLSMWNSDTFCHPAVADGDCVYF